MTKTRQIFHFSPPVQVKKDWILVLVDLEVYNSIFKITEQNKKFELYKYPYGNSVSVSYEKVGDEIEKDLDISDITAIDLEDDILGPIIINEYRNQATKRMKDDT